MPFSQCWKHTWQPIRVSNSSCYKDALRTGRSVNQHNSKFHNSSITFQRSDRSDLPCVWHVKRKGIINSETPRLVAAIYFGLWHPDMVSFSTQCLWGWSYSSSWRQASTWRIAEILARVMKAQPWYIVDLRSGRAGRGQIIDLRLLGLETTPRPTFVRLLACRKRCIFHIWSTTNCYDSCLTFPLPWLCHDCGIFRAFDLSKPSHRNWSPGNNRLVTKVDRLRLATLRTLELLIRASRSMRLSLVLLDGLTTFIPSKGILDHQAMEYR